MGFLKGLKEDFSQAMNDFMPEEELDMGNDWEGMEDTTENQESLDSVVEKKEPSDGLEQEVMAAIEALNTEKEPSKETLKEELKEGTKETSEDISKKENSDGDSDDESEEELTEEELIQRMIDEDERIKKEKEEKQAQEEQERMNENMEDIKMADQVENQELEAGDEGKDMELIAQLLGEDNQEETDLEEEILVNAKDETEDKEEILTNENQGPKEDVTVITKGTKINGSISSDGSLEIMGSINGDIDCLGKLSIIGTVAGNSRASEIYVNTARLDGGLVSKGSVKVGVGTIVVGDIKASSAVIAGAIKGEVDVNGPVVIDSTAIVKGNINAKSVQINNGAVVDGYCSLSYASVDIDNFFEGEK